MSTQTFPLAFGVLVAVFGAIHCGGTTVASGDGGPPTQDAATAKETGNRARDSGADACLACTLALPWLCRYTDTFDCSGGYCSATDLSDPGSESTNQYCMFTGDGPASCPGQEAFVCCSGTAASTCRCEATKVAGQSCYSWMQKVLDAGIREAGEAGGG
jgi:hypothetical protein